MSESPNVIDLPTNPQRYLSNVSQQLRRYPRWILYRLIPESGVLKKIPHNWRDPSIGEVSAFQDRNWGTFEECYASARLAGAWYGVGIVLVPGCSLFVIDADYRKSDKLRPFVEWVKINCPTASETSVSDNGWHGYYFGTRPENTRPKDELDLYFENQFIAVTGNGMSVDDEIADGTKLLNRLFTAAPQRVSAPVAIDEIDYESDTALITEANKFYPGHRLLDVLSTPNPFDWSDTFAGILVALASARCTKLNAYQTLEMSPFVLQSDPKAGEPRIKKLHRLFYRGNEWEKAIEFAAGRGRYDTNEVAKSLVFEKPEPRAKMADVEGLQVPQVDHIPRAIKIPHKQKDDWLIALDELIAAGRSEDDCAVELLQRGFTMDEDMIRLSYKVATKDIMVVARAAPMDHARKFVEKECMYGNFSILKCWKTDFYAWNGTYYKEHEASEIRTKAWFFLDGAVCPQYDKETELLVGYSRLTPTSGILNNMLDALKAVTHASIELVPSWLKATQPETKGTEWISFKNGIYHLARNLFLECNPYFFNTSSTSVAFDREAPPPTQWLGFLNTLWPNDPDSVACLQEIFGYLVSSDTSYQKIFGLIGPARSGKGTILRVLATLIGSGYVSTTMQQLGLGSGFGLEGLVGKSVCAIPDASLSGRTDSVTVAEILKSISGEDVVAVGRKNKTALSMQLSVRFMLAANEVLSMQDRSGALASRLIMLQMEYSFLGREDYGLGDRLVLEAPAIFNWALDGLRRLRERGRFIQPATGVAAVREAQELGSPIITFVNENYAVAGPEHWVAKEQLYVDWVTWHHRNNQKTVSSRVWFFRDLRAAFPHLKLFQPMGDDGKQHPSLKGLKRISE